jgi:hypothetical protein
MNKTGTGAFPSQETIATESGLGLRTVKQHIAKALDQGWIGKRERRFINRQGWRRNEYFATTPPAVEALLCAKRRGARATPDHPEDEAASAPPQTKNMVRVATQHGADDCKNMVQQPHTSTSRSSPRGAQRAKPVWQLSNEELLHEAKANGINTIGETRETLQRLVEAKRAS